MESVVNIAIPQIADKELLNIILKLSGEKLIKVLELGIIAYESMENQKQRWENSDFNTKIQNMESSQKEKEKKFINDLDSKNRIIKDLRREFSEKQNQLHKQIEENVRLNYQSQINFKDETIENVTKQLKESQNNMDTLRKNFNHIEMSRRDELTKEHKNEIKEIRYNYDKKIDTLQESIMTIQKINENSFFKGKVGEDKMKQTLTMLFPKNEIEDTHSQPGRGDFIITCKNDKKILIDNKDYSTNVPKKEIDKFEKDIRENTDVFGGVLISNSSGVSKKDDFQIDIINSKPVMYLHNTNNNNNKIKCAIDLIESILCANHIDFQDKEICDKLCKISSEIKRKINKIKRDMDKHAKNIIETVLNIETLIKDVFLNTCTKY
tara:strand:+ start:2698 stop:3837 length:1140 start_codon:yes stop_codon:yes gene_type:complete